MTIAIPAHRAFATKLAPRSFNVVTRWGYNPWLLRVHSNSNDGHDGKITSLNLKLKSTHAISTRSYATTSVSKPASRPKAHTGRTAAKRATKSSTSSKPGPKTAAGKKAVGRKPKAKSTKAKAKPKAKPKPKAKKPAVKKAPSAASLLRDRRAKDKELKEKALLDPPKQLPATQWSVIFSEAQKNAKSFDRTGQNAKEAVQKLKSLTPEEKEHYNHVANQNKAANESAYKKWLSQYSPQQIREANNARHQLKRQFLEKHPKRKSVLKFASLKDDRLVARPKTAYILFSKDRHASGDFAHMTVAESAKLIGREWKALDGSEKKKYEDEAASDKGRYQEEYTSVYGEAPKQVKRAKSTT